VSLTRNKPDYAPLDAADARTLALAAGTLDDAMLDRYVRHQEVYLAAAEDALHKGQPYATALTEAHRLAEQASGLTPRNEGALMAAVRAFCTVRHAVALLDRKLARLEAQGAPESERAEVRSERARLDAMVPLEQRYGAEALARLKARETTLMGLHERTTRLLSRGG
jgi:hypothetical protein